MTCHFLKTITLVFCASLLVGSPAIADAVPAEFVGTLGNEAFAQKKKSFTSIATGFRHSRHRPFFLLGPHWRAAAGWCGF